MLLISLAAQAALGLLSAETVPSPRRTAVGGVVEARVSTDLMASFEMRKQAIRADLINSHLRLGNVLEQTEGRWLNVGPTQDWNVRELLAHLATAEAGHLATVRRIAAGEGGVPDNFDADRWNAGQLRRTADLDVASLRQRLDAAHAEMLTALEATTELAMSQPARLATGANGTLADEFTLVAAHKREHTLELEAALADRAAP
jgi:hypothetical protein